MRRKHVLAAAVPFLVLLVVLVGACSSKEDSKTQTEQAASMTETTPKKASEPVPAAPDTLDEVAILETNHGTIVLEFFPKDAPGHVANFKKLARAGFFDGTRFHRVVKGFMIQGGDPLTKDANPDNDGTGGPGYRIKAEFNKQKHLKGTLSMARGQDPNSAGSQFFICLADAASLDGQYTVFGRVIKGLEVVDCIGNVNVKANKWNETSVPVEPVVLKKVVLFPRAEFLKGK